MLETFTLQTFTPLVQDTFQLSPDPGPPLPLTLVAVKELGEESPVGRQGNPFALLFRSAPGVPLPQRIYRLEHAGLGSFDLFLVPIGADRTGVEYEAVFT